MSDELRNNEELEQQQEDVVVEETPTEEVVEDAVNTDEVPEEANPEKTDEEVASDSEVEESEEDASVKEEVEESSEEAPKEEEEKEEEPSEDAPTDTPVEGEVEEIPNVEELKAQIDDFKFEQEMQVEVKKLTELDNILLDEATKSRQAAQQALEMAAQKFDIPLDKSMADLEKEDPKKAALAKELLQRTEVMLQQRAIELEKIREDEAAKVVFKKAERLFNKFELNQDQAMVAAETFIDIIRATGVDDLGEDLKNKVELAVAKALMKHPIVMEVHDKIEEIKADSDTSDSKVPSEKIEEEEIEKVEEKEEVPPTPTKDLSAYMEGAADGATSKVASVNIDNVLDLLASTPFKERTAFYKEHQDLINQAMSKRRG